MPSALASSATRPTDNPTSRAASAVFGPIATVIEADSAEQEDARTDRRYPHGAPNRELHPPAPAHVADDCEEL